MAGVPPSYGRPSQRLSRTVRGRQAAPLAACRTLPSHSNQTAARRPAATNWRDTGTPAVREAGHASLLQCWAVLSHRHAEQRQSAGHHAGRRCSTCALAGADQHRRPSRCSSVVLQSPRCAGHAIASDNSCCISHARRPLLLPAPATKQALAHAREALEDRACSGARRRVHARCIESGYSHIAPVSASPRRPSLSPSASDRPRGAALRPSQRVAPCRDWTPMAHNTALAALPSTHDGPPGP
jgi:hypothetical protein